MILKYVIHLTSEVVGEIVTCHINDSLIILLPRRVIGYHIRKQKVELFETSILNDDLLKIQS